MWKKRTLHISDLVAVKRQRHTQPVAVHGKRDLGRPTLKVHHCHNDVSLREPPTKVAELVVGRELCSASVAVRVLLLSYGTSQYPAHDAATAEFF